MSEVKHITLMVTDRRGEISAISAQSDHTNVMQVLFDGEQEIEAVCGGCCSCATCHVYVDPKWASSFPERSENEAMLLEYSEHFDSERSRLSCQLEISSDLDGMCLELAPEE